MKLNPNFPSRGHRETVTCKNCSMDSIYETATWGKYGISVVVCSFCAKRYMRTVFGSLKLPNIKFPFQSAVADALLHYARHEQ